MRGLDLVWESATPPTHSWERSPKKKFFLLLPYRYKIYPSIQLLKIKNALFLFPPTQIVPFLFTQYISLFAIFGPDNITVSHINILIFIIFIIVPIFSIHHPAYPLCEIPPMPSWMSQGWRSRMASVFFLLSIIQC